MAKSQIIKREEAQERNERYRRLTPQQKIAALDARLGKGVGAAKQRARLQELLKEQK